MIRISQTHPELHRGLHCNLIHLLEEGGEGRSRSAQAPELEGANETLRVTRDLEHHLPQLEDQRTTPPDMTDKGKMKGQGYMTSKGKMKGQKQHDVTGPPEVPFLADLGLNHRPEGEGRVEAFVELFLATVVEKVEGPEANHA